MQNMPIGIFRGDDTDAFSYQTIVGTINTDLDLTGCKAVFRYLGFSMEFDPIPEDRKLTIVIPAGETKKFPPGLGYASLRVYDSDGRLKTFSNRIMVFVATKTPMFGSDEFEVDFNVRASLEPLKFFVGPNPDDFDEYRGYLEKVIDRASAAKYGLAILLDAIDSDLGANNGVAATPVAVKAAYAAIIKKLTDNYYTAEETDEAIDRVAAYYITYDAAGNPFPTYAALANAQTVYSGGQVRTPTRNDYCVVLADETHDNAEYRYIYAVAEGQTTGSWQPQFPVEGVMTVDQTVTKNSQNPVSGGGVWSMIWGTLWSIPGGLSSVYAWVLDRLGLKRDLTDMSCTVAVTGIPQIGSGNFVVTSPSGTSTTLTPFDSSGVIGWGWYMTYPYIYARASNSYDIIFGTGISDMIPLNMTAETQTVTYNGETWTVAAFTGEIVNTRLANMTDLPPASTSTPAMDGTGSAGSSAAYARGDHVHPTDTSRMAANATGADIAVSGSDSTKIDAALTGKATKADATLTDANTWTFEPATFNGYPIEMREVETYPSTNPGVYFFVPYANGEEIGLAYYDTIRYATSLSLQWYGPTGDSPSSAIPLTATRTALQGYQLGSQDGKPLASEAEAEALRTAVAGKQNALSAQQLANIAAVSDALAFDATHSYSAGDPVVYNGTLYTFTSAHTGAWTGSDVSAVDIIARLAGKLDKSGGTANNLLICGTNEAIKFDDDLLYIYRKINGAWVAQNVWDLRTSQDGTPAFVADIPYSLGAPTVINAASSETVEGETVYYGAATLADRTANVVQVTAATALDELRITFPAATSGKVRDFGLRVEIGTGSAALAAPALVPVAPTGETIKIENADRAIPELADGTATAKGVTLLYFSENAPGVFVVKGEQVEEVA